MKMYSTNVIKCTCRRICEGNIFYYIARGCTQGAIPTPENLKEEYHKKRDRIRRQLKEHSVDSQDIFANDELSLKRVNVYGFDYDFTLVHYKREVNELIYNRAKEILVDRMAYPSDIKNLSHFKFNPDFAIRGVHLDKRHGLLMKMDAYHRIQLGSVYRGHQLVDSSQVIERYGGAYVPLYSDHQHQDSMKLSHNHIQFLDSFSKPEVALFADVSEYFIKRKIEFDSEYLFMDVSSAIYGVHQSGDLHNAIAKDPDRFIQSNPNMPDLLRRLKAAGKKLFLLTNNRFVNVNKGMYHMFKSDEWRELFDVIICSTRKPKFYNDVNRPFRSLDPSTLLPTWPKVTELKRGNEVIYHQGNIKEFVKLTGWKGSEVLYIGDHILSDLTDPSLHLGWKTGVIIPELETEITKINSPEYKNDLSALIALETLLSKHQGQKYNGREDLKHVIQEWKDERRIMRKQLKDLFNPYFGSIFRTERGPSYFSRRIMRFASLYMSSLDNLMKVSLDHTFYPRRASLPHESDVKFDI